MDHEKAEIAYLVSKELARKYIKPWEFQKALGQKRDISGIEVMMLQSHELQVTYDGKEVYLLDTLSPTFEFDGFDKYVDEAVQAIRKHEKKLINSSGLYEALYEINEKLRLITDENVTCGINLKSKTDFDYRLWIRINQKEFISKLMKFKPDDKNIQQIVENHLMQLTAGMNLYYDLGGEIIKRLHE